MLVSISNKNGEALVYYNFFPIVFFSEPFVHDNLKVRITMKNAYFASFTPGASL